ncbi:amino acid ABC transporter ATP-binding protein [Campylobacter novaezeelandiae]|uniref:amino acid ABC transporter ATP-binding protein n=1 Tax=Campylobacter novaezeelandiae TaxID=2267891 RepID=UPI00190828A3|nr:amino acid ABC transporter ATP-binding protein [Campylobacter novaezeelandiae]MBK1964170.1 amino acid ABC transporter ATP-binding protein [Campylobacter novaezeelandiae]MBK1992926.1 amino acid ABC transporter ATP-binding protein [Campylobacter novaezeelandiae]
MIKIKNLSKKYGNLNVLKNINIQINKGDIIAIIGPSGSGKSTFLRCINKLEIATSGEIYIKNQNILDPTVNIDLVRQKVSMVFQHFNLFNNKNILENLCLAPIKTKILTKDEAIKKARILLKKIGLNDKENAMPHQLSGGQKQRIAIARSLMMNPDVILFDEPTSALDPEMIGEVLNIMKEVAKEGLTMLVVTHEMGFAKNVANRILFIEQGNIVVDENPYNTFENPTNERLKEFLNKVLNH